MPSKRSRQAPRLQGAGMSGPLGAGGYASGEHIGSSNARARAATSMNTVCTATEVEAVLDIDAVEVEAVDDIDESIEVAIEVEVVLVGESRMDTGSSTTPRVSTDDVQHLRANKARAAAAAEGLELVPSSKNQTGFKGVNLTHGRYYLQIYENGKQSRNFGSFATREEAALCYARHIGAERAAAEAAKERGEGLNTTKPLTADEARAAAAAEGLELVPSSKNQTGFKGVTLARGRYNVDVYENGKMHRLGCFATPEEAALCYARHLGAERAAAEAAKERGEGLNTTKPLTADEARAAAAAEGLELVPSSKNQTGFKGVTLTQGRYYVQVSKNGKQSRNFGGFATPEEAALCYARHIATERAAAEAAKERGEGLNTTKPLTADEARAAAAAEGLELVPSSKNQTGFKGVNLIGGKYYLQVYKNGKQSRNFGGFATPEEAALCYARHLATERAAAEATGEGPQPLTVDEAKEIDGRHTSGRGSLQPVEHPAPPGPSCEREHPAPPGPSSSE